MTRNEILDRLGESDRWGVNYQPDLDEMVDFLAEVSEGCGLRDLRVEARDMLSFRTARPLTPSLAFRLGRMMFDGLPEEIDDRQTHFTLWWD